MRADHFDATALHDYATSLGPLGPPQSLTICAARKRGGMQMRSHTVALPQVKPGITTYTLPDGRLEQYIVAPIE